MESQLFLGVKIIRVMFYADDAVPLAGSKEEKQKNDWAASFAQKFEIVFGEGESQVMAFDNMLNDLIVKW